MNIVQLNLTYGIGSTGKIMRDLADVIETNEHNCYMVAGYSNEKNNSKLFCFNKGNALNAIRKDILISRITGEMGYRNSKKTIEAMKWIDSKNPDVIHLHNIHGDWINVNILFKYIKEKNIPVVWTLHDCWSFTGRCSYFDSYGCDAWKTGCKIKCENKIYPLTYFFDKTEKMWKDKKSWFTNVNKMMLITPSKWLNDYLSESYLKDYPKKVIHNGIDISIFHPINDESFYLSGCNDKKIILGVANSWTERKGLKDFIRLNELLDKKRYQIVLVGLNENQLKSLPNTIIGIGKTNNQRELVSLYSNASVFVNPTYQDNFPTTNLEAIACGTPVITYNTGGSPESVLNGVGFVVEKGDIKGLLSKIVYVCENPTLFREKCITVGKELFNKNNNYLSYIDIYNDIIKESTE